MNTIVLGGGPAVAALALGLTQLSFEATGIDWPVAPTDISVRPGWRQALADRISSVGTSTETVPGLVVILIDPSPVSSLSSLDEKQWQADCETPLWMARTALQLTHRVLRRDPGRLIFIVSAAALSGSGGSVASSAVAEGVRALAKSAAGAWSAENITVNCLAVAEVSLASEALMRDDIAPLVRSLASCGPLVNGSTLVADGGTSMFL